MGADFTIEPMLSLGPPESGRVRSAWARLREICCETALSGKPLADRRRWPFFGDLWIGPYESRCPEWTWVALDSSGRVEGYLTGCPDTRAMGRYLQWRRDPALLLLLLLRRYPWNVDTRSFVRRRFGLATHPEKLFEPAVMREVNRDFPAHLHTNVSDALRGKGAGGELVATYARALRSQEVRGIHLFCGPAPVRFYERCGFRVQAIREVRPGVPVHLMVMPIPR